MDNNNIEFEIKEVFDNLKHCQTGELCQIIRSFKKDTVEPKTVEPKTVEPGLTITATKRELLLLRNHLLQNKVKTLSLLNNIYEVPDELKKQIELTYSFIASDLFSEVFSYIGGNEICECRDYRYECKIDDIIDEWYDFLAFLIIKCTIVAKKLYYSKDDDTLKNKIKELKDNHSDSIENSLEIIQIIAPAIVQEKYGIPVMAVVAALLVMSKKGIMNYIKGGPLLNKHNKDTIVSTFNKLVDNNQ